jgi:hypothetical protein
VLGAPAGMEHRTTAWRRSAAQGVIRLHPQHLHGPTPKREPSPVCDIACLALGDAHSMPSQVTSGEASSVLDKS